MVFSRMGVWGTNRLCSSLFVPQFPHILSWLSTLRSHGVRGADGGANLADPENKPAPLKLREERQDHRQDEKDSNRNEDDLLCAQTPFFSLR